MGINSAASFGYLKLETTSVKLIVENCPRQMLIVSKSLLASSRKLEQSRMNSLCQLGNINRCKSRRRIKRKKL